jgi:type IV fimbrial biogenesis protein FimT
MGEGIQPTIHSRREAAGFTLVELLAVILIAAILLGLGIPAMQSVIQANQLAAVTDDMVSSLSLARNEAIKFGGTVKMSTPGDTNWGRAPGWTMQVIYPDGTLGPVLRKGTPAPPAYTMYSSDSFEDSLKFDSTGRIVGGQAGQFIICEAGGPPGGSARLITVAASGRIRIAQNYNAAGWPLDDNGRPLDDCGNH